MRTTEETLRVIAMGLHQKNDGCEDCPMVRMIAEDMADQVERFVIEGRLSWKETGIYLRLIKSMINSADTQTAIGGLIAMFEDASENEDDAEVLSRYLYGCIEASERAREVFLEKFFAEDLIDGVLIDEEIDRMAEKPGCRLN